MLHRDTEHYGRHCSDANVHIWLSPPAKGKGKETYSSLQAKPVITATGTHLPYAITQCYLPPGRGDIPAFTPAEAGT